jgi:hypothetical protein
VTEACRRMSERSARGGRAGTMAPPALHRCGPRRIIRRSDGEHRAPDTPWSQARATMRRQVSWLAGHGTMHAFPCRFISWPAQWLPVCPSKECRPSASRSPLTVAGTAMDLRGRPPAPHSLLGPVSGAPARSFRGQQGWFPVSGHRRKDRGCQSRRRYRCAGFVQAPREGQGKHHGSECHRL